MSKKFDIQTESKSETHGIQEYLTKILKKHETNPKAFAYILQLFILGINDLMVHKKGDKINIGYNYHFLSTQGELMPDIILSFDIDNNGTWIPDIMEDEIFENTVEDKIRLDELLDILKGQGWLETGKINCKEILESKLQKIT